MTLSLITVEGNDSIKTFQIGKYPVTQREYEAIIGDNPSEFAGNPDNPVEEVTWYDAVMYCNKLSEREGIEPYYLISKIRKEGNNIIAAEVAICGGNGYRLPTDIEWEYAAKGGNKSMGYKYSGSDDIDDVAWYKQNSEETTHPVGQKKPNELGIYDMTGNVWEWNETNSGSIRYFRGASWFNAVNLCKVEFQNSNDAYDSGDNLGFRVCRASS